MQQAEAVAVRQDEMLLAVHHCMAPFDVIQDEVLRAAVTRKGSAQGICLVMHTLWTLGVFMDEDISGGCGE